MERTLVLIKPDAVQRNLIGQITSRLERKGLKLIGMKMLTVNQKLLHEHYAHLVSKPFFAGLAKFMQSTPIVAQCWEGVSAIEVVRRLCGATNAREAALGTIRGDLAISPQSNLIHASDSAETAQKEVPRFFAASELFDYQKTEYQHLYAEDEITE